MAKNPRKKWFRRNADGKNHSIDEVILVAFDTSSLERYERLLQAGDGPSGGDTGPTIRALKGNIAEQEVDAVVNAANERLVTGAGVAGAIHRGAGPCLAKKCAELYPEGCPTGEARVTGGYSLPAKWIIHTVGPRWSGGNRGEADLLAACYRNSLQAASEIEARIVAFPAISTGVYGYPPDEAAEVAVATIREFLAEQGGD